MEKIESFLWSPDINRDAFWDSDALIWVDESDFDIEIIDYFNQELPPEAQIDYEYVEIKKDRGVDTTLKSIQKYIAPRYQIRWYMDSLGCDTLAFCILSSSRWKQLEQKFGADKVIYYFVPIQEDSKMFAMNFGEVSTLLKQRKKHKCPL